VSRSSAPRLDSVAPILSVDDVPAALDWYQRVLGFGVAWRWGDPVGLASVCRENVELNLGKRGEYGAPGPSHVYIRLTGVDAYYEQLQRAGAAIRVPIDDRVYGLRDFSVEDASGNRLDFGEPLEGAEEDA
jgi:uncharacterized glyoxalase superfamily protein PhnB